jgi:hypothetical protein
MSATWSARTPRTSMDGRPRRGPTFHPQRANARQVIVLPGEIYSCVAMGSDAALARAPGSLGEVPPGAGADPRRFQDRFRKALFGRERRVCRKLFRRRSIGGDIKAHAGLGTDAASSRAKRIWRGLSKSCSDSTLVCEITHPRPWAARLIPDRAGTS